MCLNRSIPLISHIVEPCLKFERESTRLELLFYSAHSKQQTTSECQLETRRVCRGRRARISDVTKQGGNHRPRLPVRPLQCRQRSPRIERRGVLTTVAQISLARLSQRPAAVSAAVTAVSHAGLVTWVLTQTDTLTSFRYKSRPRSGCSNGRATPLLPILLEVSPSQERASLFVRPQDTEIQDVGRAKFKASPLFKSNVAQLLAGTCRRDNTGAKARQTKDIVSLSKP